MYVHTLSLRDALPILFARVEPRQAVHQRFAVALQRHAVAVADMDERQADRRHGAPDPCRPGHTRQQQERYQRSRAPLPALDGQGRSEEHTSELQSLMRISYAVFCLKKKNKTITISIS